jgi:hypothetical protein
MLVPNPSAATRSRPAFRWSVVGVGSPAASGRRTRPTAVVTMAGMGRQVNSHLKQVRALACEVS